MYISAQSALEIRDYLFSKNGFNSPATRTIYSYTSSLEGGYQVHFGRVTAPGEFPLVISVSIQDTEKELTVGDAYIHLSIPNKDVNLAEALWEAVQRVIGKLYIKYLSDTLGVSLTATTILADILTLEKAKVFNPHEVVVTNRGYDITLEDEHEVIFHDTMIRQNVTGFIRTNSTGHETYHYTGKDNIDTIADGLIASVKEAIMIRLFSHPAISTEKFLIS